MFISYNNTIKTLRVSDKSYWFSTTINLWGGSISDYLIKEVQ